jgi:hypothetical protein
VDDNVLRRRNVNAKPTEYVKRLTEQLRLATDKNILGEAVKTDSLKKSDDFFQNEFANEKKDSSQLGKVVTTDEIPNAQTILKKARLFEYRPPKYFIDYAVTGFNNSVFGTSFQPYANGSGPVQLSNGDDFNGLIRMGTSDLFEDVKFSGGFRLATGNFSDYDVLFQVMNYRKRLDWGGMLYRTNEEVAVQLIDGKPSVVDPGDPNVAQKFLGLRRSNLFLAQFQYPLDKVRSVRLKIGPRFDNIITKASGDDLQTLKVGTLKKIYNQFDLAYIYDNTINPALNIWKGLRYKAYFDWYTQVSQLSSSDGRFLLNAGFDVRRYVQIYRNVIWAVRAGGEFSWGNQKVIYYLGGVDGWFAPKFNNENKPDPTVDYTYQSLANLRGFKQNVANGSNAVTLSSEVRMPVFSTLLNRPINNAFIRNFQLVQFIDLGNAWTGFKNIERPRVVYGTPPITVLVKAGGVGPLAGGYGFGARSTLLGYFVRFDAAWEMSGFFRGKPQMYVALGLDF